jgi:membrane protein YdbS with pleckstrin-like domain
MKLTFPLLLFTVFLVLKLCDVIAWSWWWVSAPIWIPFAIGAICMLVVGFIYLFETPEQKKARKLQESVDAFSRAFRKTRS